jgi:cyclophilin family peptidyl-prolyl cis-trans isomerase
MPDGATPAGRRRVDMLRCAAAKTLAGANFKDPLLVGCDLDKGAIGSRAAVEVVGRGSLEGARLEAWRKLVADPDVRTREAALELLGAHPEVPDASKVLLAALGAKEGGVVATAADQIGKSPRLASEKAEKKKPKKGDKKPPKEPPANDPKQDEEAGDTALPPSPAVVKALLEALARGEKEQDPELLGSVMDALGALAVKEASPKLEELCASTYPVVREHAGQALGLLEGRKRVCAAPDVAGPAPPELALVGSGLPATKETTLVFDTDAGELRVALDPLLAPVATLRFADLARSGYYDGTIIHRVDASFVVQLGSPFGDGFGGPAGRQALRCETSPVPFGPLDVGVALAGRDTGSSQIFVMRSRQPHLDGGYARVGKASGPWDLVSEGDVIRRARVE